MLGAIKLKIHHHFQKENYIPHSGLIVQGILLIKRYVQLINESTV